jgi:hypothetical protein
MSQQMTLNEFTDEYIEVAPRLHEIRSTLAGNPVYHVEYVSKYR